MRKTKKHVLSPSDQATAAAPALEQDVLDALLVKTTPVAPPPDRAAAIKMRVLDRVRATARMLENTLTIYCKIGKWMPIAPGVSAKALYADDSGHSFLLRLDADATLPAHPHDGDEECIVVEGEVQLGDLNIRAGDYHLARRGSRHEDIYSPAGALLFIRRKGSVQESARG